MGKKMKRYILLMLVFLGNVVPMQCMMTVQRARSPLSQSASRYRNLMASPALQKSRINAARTNIPSSSVAQLQTRFYSSPASNPTPRQSGILDWLKSFFVQNPVPELKAKGLDGIMYELLYPQHTKHVVDMAGIERTIRFFDENDRKKAEDWVDQFVEQAANPIS